MKYIWGSLFAGILGLGFINQFIIRFGRAADLFVLLHIILTIAILMRFRHGYREILVFAFLLRIVFMIWDLRFSYIFTMPNAGGDAIGFFLRASEIGNNISLLSQPYGDTYSRIMGALYYITGVSRMLGQYINVLLGISIVILIRKSMKLLGLRRRSVDRATMIAAYFPNSIIMSSIFLREMYPAFFVAASLFFFCRWFIRSSLIDMLMSIAMLAFASIFHSGMIGLMLGYSFAFLFYNRRRNGFAFSGITVSSFVIISILLYLGATQYSDVFFGKFQNVEEGHIFWLASKAEGGSAYLPGLEINNVSQLLMYLPIKMLYFLGSPMPWDWRGGMDLFTFLADSLFYLYCIAIMVKQRKFFAKNQVFVLIIALCALGAMILFGVGVSNAGTALRHRQKLLPVFIIMLSIVSESKPILSNIQVYRPIREGEFLK